MISIFFNGTLMDLNNFNGSQGVSFVFRKKTESGQSAFSFSPELTLTGAAFDLVFNQIINTPNPVLCSIDVEVYDDCCQGLLFTGIIKGSDVSWCEIPNCECTVTIIDNSTDAAAIACLKNTFPWDRLDKADGSGVSLGEDTFRTAPNLTYCVDVRPGFLQEIILIVGILMIIVLYPLAVIVGAIVTALNAVIFIVGGTPIGGNVNFFDDAFDLITELERILIGCGRKHKTPFIHSQLKNLCDICGITLSSSIFDPGGDYHNTMRLDAAYKAGGLNLPKINANYEKNKPNINGVQFLDSFKDFNLDWNVTNGVLNVERKDFLSGGLWFDATLLDQNDIISLCFNALDDVAPAYAEYQYLKDGIDNTSDEVNPDWTDVIDWNSPVNPAQSGLFSRNFNFSTAQFREDSGRDNVSALDKSIYIAFLPILNDYDGVMLMERGICGFPRLLQWDGISDPADARVKRYFHDTSYAYDYNVDWWAKEAYTDGNGISHDTLYQRFLYIDDPRITTIKKRRYTLTIAADCSLVSTINVDGFIRLSQGGTVYEGDISEVTYDMQQNTLTIQGKI